MLTIKGFRHKLTALISSPTAITVFMTVFLLTAAIPAAAKGVYHTVKKGETLWRICNTYGVSTKEISRVNKIRNSERIRVGQKIYIPGKSKLKKITNKSTKKANTKKSARQKKSKIVKGRFEWPVKGHVSNQFGVNGGTSQDGIDILARKGTAIKASDNGEVVHATNDMRVFGNIIILRHKGDFYTLYAHNDKNLVKIGDNVKKGEKIAMVGNSGGADKYKLHFELRDGRNVRNPLLFLPK